MAGQIVGVLICFQTPTYNANVFHYNKIAINNCENFINNERNVSSECTTSRCLCRSVYVYEINVFIKKNNLTLKKKLFLRRKVLPQNLKHPFNLLNHLTRPFYIFL